MAANWLKSVFPRLTSRTARRTDKAARSKPTLVQLEDRSTPAASFTIQDFASTEGNAGPKNFTFNVNLTVDAADVGKDLSIDFTTANGVLNPANAGVDYTSAAGTLTFTNATLGTTTQVVTVQVTGDTVVEANEQFFVNLSNATSNGTAPVILDSQGLGTISNDDKTTLTVGTPSILEGNTGNQTLTFTVTSSNAVQAGFMVAINTADGTATLVDNDYDAGADVLTFAGNAGESQPFDVTINGDKTVEANETLQAILGTVTPTNVAIPTTNFLKTNNSGTITNDDTTVLTVGDKTVTEGNAGTQTVTFTVTSSKAVQGGFILGYATVDGTATGGSDFVAATGTVSFIGTANESKTFSVTVNGDTTVELDEMFTVTLGPVTGTAAPATGFDTTDTAAGTITDNDSASISIADASATEGAGVMFNITLTNPVDVPIMLTLTPSIGGGDTAEAGDFDGTVQTITIPANTTTFTATVNTTVDTQVERNETFTATISNAVVSGRNVTVGAADTATGTINDDDTTTVSVDSVSVTEGNAGTVTLTFTVTSSNAVENGFTVAYTTAGGTATAGAAADYLTKAGTLTFTGTAGETQTVMVTVNGDTVVEANETFNLTLGTVTPPAGVPTNKFTLSNGTGTITDDDSTNLMVDSPTVTEGTGGSKTLTFTVASSAAVQGGFSVAYNTADGTATAGSDYTAKTGTLTFAGTAGETQTFVVTINPDTVVEANETIFGQLGTVTPNNVLIPTSKFTATNGTGTLTDDDASTLTVNSPTVLEGNAGTKLLTFTVTLSNAVQGGLTVDYNTAAGAGTTVGTDYVGDVSGTLTFVGTAGETQTFSVTVNGDTDLEPNDTVLGQLTNVVPNNAGIPSATVSTTNGTGTIQNDDAATLTVSSPSITEGNAGTQTLTFTVTLSGTVQGGFTVAYNTADGTATTGGDYVAAVGVLTFNGTSGESKTFDVTVNGDTVVEANETILGQLGTIVPNNPLVLASSISKVNGTGTVTDDDTTTLMVSTPTVVEGTGGSKTVTFTVTSSNAVQGGFTVGINTVDGTAAAPADYTAATNTLTFSGTAGETQTFLVTINPDSAVEQPNETFTAHLGTVTPANNAIPASGVNSKFVEVDGQATITDDDTTVVTVADVTQAENAGKMTFTVTLSNAVQGGFTVQYKTADGTAVSTNLGAVGDNDFQAATGTLTFTGTAGETQTFQVTINADAVVEANEQFALSLFNVVPSNALIPASNIDATDTANGTITNDDVTILTVADVSQLEAAAPGTMTFTVKSSLVVQGGFTVAYSTIDGTATVANNDYTATTGTLTFAGTANETQSFTVTINDDSTVEAAETFTVALGPVTSTTAPTFGPTNGFNTTDTAAGTIQNDDSTTLTVGDITQAENGGPMTFTVTLSNAVQGGFAVNFATANGVVANKLATTADNDYAAKAGTLNFTGTAGESKTFTVTINDDSKVEADELFTVALSNVVPTNPLITPVSKIDATDTATGTITNDDATTVTVADVSQAENGGPMTFTVTLSNPVQGGFTVDYATADGVVVNMMATTADNDYVAKTGTLNFAGTAGEAKTFQVTITGDGKVENDEKFSVSLSNVMPANPLITPLSKIDVTDTAIGTIQNDDAGTADVDDQTAPESGTITFNITLSSPVDTPVTVTYTLTDGTAVGGVAMVQGVDFTYPGGVATGTVTFNPGETSKQVVVPLVDDLRVEGTEAFNITLSNLMTNRSITIGDGSGVGTITDNDTASLTYNFANSSTAEDNVTKTVGLTLTVNPTGTVGVAGLDRNIDAGIVVSGSAAQGAGPLADYAFTGLAAPSFPTGSNGTTFNKTVTIQVFEDLTNEGNETVVLTLNPTDASGGQLQKLGTDIYTHTFNILDDDGTTRTYNPTVTGGYRLVRNGGNVQLFMGGTLLAQDSFVATPSAILITGTAGNDTLDIDMSGGNPIPAAGVTFDGGAGNDTLTVSGGTYTNVSDNYTSATDGNLNFDGSVVNYKGIEDSKVNVASVQNFTLNLPAASTNAATLQDAGAGQAEFAGATFVHTTFTKPTASLNVNAGKATDGLTVNALNAGGANALAGAGGTAFQTIAIAGPLAAANTTLVAGTATQTGKIATGTLTLGAAGNTGTYTLTNAANDASTLAVPLAAAVTYADASDLTLAASTTSGALSVSAGNNLTVPSGTTVQSTGGNVTLNAANNFTAVGATLQAANTKTIAIAIDTDNNAGATADISKAVIAAAGTTVVGNANNDTFRTTKYGSPVSINGKAPTGTPTGDTLVYDAQNQAVIATANSFDTVSYTDIELVTVQNAGAFTLNGTGGDDRVTVSAVGSPAAPLQYKFDSQPTAVAVAIGANPFAFNGLAGSDTLIVDYSKGSPVPAGGITFDGGADADIGLAVAGKNNATATFTSAAGLGGIVQLGTDKIAFSNLETTSQVDITGVTSVAVNLPVADKGITIDGGNKSNTLLTTAEALTVSGTTIPQIRLSNAQNVVISTDAKNGGNDAITILGGANAHGVVNLAINAPDDAITGKGRLAVAGGLAVLGNAITLQDGGDLLAGGDLTVTNNGTLSIGKASVVGQHVTQNTGPVVLTGSAFVQGTAATGDTITFNGAIDGPGGLTAFSKGNTVFNKAVGATTPLLHLTTDTGGETRVNGGLVRTSSLQFYNDKVVTSTSATFSATAGSIVFADEVVPTTDGLLDLVIGGPSVDVLVSKGLNAATKFRNVLISDAHDVTFNGGVNVQRLVQTTGTGKTSVLDVTVRDATPVTGGVSGGAINLNTNAIALNGNVSSPNAPVVLGLTGANGTATQVLTGTGIATSKLYLHGAGAFAINNAANAFNAAGAGEVFASVDGGSIDVRDSTDLVIAFEDAANPATAIRVGNNGSVTLTTSGNFTAVDPVSQASTVPTTKMFDVGSGGTVQVNFGLNPNNAPRTEISYEVKVQAEATAQTFTIGQPLSANATPAGLALANQAKDVFTVRPMTGAVLVVNGNNPVVADGETLSPFDTLKPQFKNVTGIQLRTRGNGDGSYSFTGFKDLQFTSIETLGGLSLEAFAVQTAPRADSTDSTGYAVRAAISQVTEKGQKPVPVGGNITGTGISSNSFVVSPNRESSASSFKAPSLAVADVDGDGTQDLIIANGAGDAPIVTVVRGTALTGSDQLNLSNLQPNQILAQFFAYEETFRGGVNVSAADIDGDGRAEIAVGSGVGGGPLIRVFSIADLKTNPNLTVFTNANPIYSFFPYEDSFRGGVNVAIGDLNGDGQVDLIAGAGVGGGPRVRILDIGAKDPSTSKFVFFPLGADGKQSPRVINDFFAYESTARGGVLVTAGRFDGDSTDDLMTAPGMGGPRLRIYLGGTGVSSIPAENSMSAVDMFAFPTTTGLISGDNTNTLGIGSIAFGASADGTGANRSVLVSRPRGTSFQISRFTHELGSTTLTLVPGDQDFEVALNNGQSVIDVGGSRPLSFSELTGGGTVAGGTSQSN